MQVGMVSTFLCKCGLATYSNYLSDALIKQGVGTTVLAEYPYPDDSALDKDFKTDVPYFYCWNRNEPYTRIVKESSSYDILHLQHQYGLFPKDYTYIKLLHEAKAPIIITLHDIVPPNERMLTYFNETFHNVKKVITHTTVCKYMVERWNCPKEKLELIPHGTKLIDVPSKAEARKILNLPEDAEILLSWGFIWESKGILELVKILLEIKRTHPKAIFIHAGGIHPILSGSAYLKNILKFAVQNGLTPKDLLITQWIPEDKVPIWFGAADLIVLNYMRGSASASGAAHRAMAGHRPIIGTDDPCIVDIPKYTVPRFSETDMYQGILKVLEDEALQKELVLKAEQAANETSWAKVALQHKKLYAKI